MAYNTLTLISLYLIVLGAMRFTCFSLYPKDLSSCKDAATTTEEQYNAELSTVSFQILMVSNIEPLFYLY